MIPRPPRSTRTDTLFPYPTLFRSGHDGYPYTHCWSMSTLLMDLVRLLKHFSMSRSAPAGMSGQDIDQMILRELGRIIRTAAVSPGDAQAAIAIAQIKAFIADHLEADLRCGTLAANFDIRELTLAPWFHRSEERRVGKECVSTYRYRGCANH